MIKSFMHLVSGSEEDGVVISVAADLDGGGEEADHQLV